MTNIGFDFWYDGVRFTQFSCNANGICRLGGTVVTTEFDNGSATFGFNTTTNAPKIAPYFDDLWTGTNGKVHFKVTGSAPNRKLIVEWLNEQIPRVASGNTGAGTFQMWMFETTGVVEFVYGSGVATNSANGGYSVGLQSGAATNFASVTSSGPTVSYAAANNTQTNAITSGTAYIFTPQIAADPTGLNFTGTTALSTTLNWNDNSSNEVGFAVYRSTDGGVNYNFLTQTAAGATSFTDNTVSPNTTYFYRVFAVTEGAVSNAAQNSVTTSPAGNISSTAAGGNWSDTATWVGGVVPTATDNVTIVDGATVTIDTAAVAFSVTVGTGGTVCTIGNASSTLASFDLGTSLTSTITISGGTIVHQLASTGSTQIDYRMQSGGGITGVTGGTLQLGNAASGAAKAFVMRGVVPNLVLTNTSANHSASWSTTLVNFNNISLNITVNTGTTLNFSNVVFLFNGTTLTNNGTLTHNGASSNFVWFNAAAPMTYTGTGTVTAPMSNMAIQADSGLIFDPSVSNVVVGALRLFSGSVTNSNKITLGNGGATTGVTQIGNTTTPTNAGTFDVPLTFNLGTGGQTISYLRTTNTRTTGNEVNPTRTLTSMTYDDNDATHTLSIAGGDITLSSTGTALTLTNGRVVTNGNTLALSSGTATVTRTNGYVDGNFRKTYSAAASKSFEVGTANGFSPVTVNSTAGTYPGDFTVSATQGQLPQISGTNALQRYWTLSNNITGNVANLTFNYPATDVVGTAANYVFVKNNGGTLINNIPPASPPTTTQATINGVSSFSDWTLAEPNAVQPGAFQFSSATYSDSETNADHTFNVVVNRVGGSDGNASVDYQVTDGTATVSDNDYSIAAPTGTLNWSAGDATSRNITITVKGDTKFEPDETVNFQLNNPQGGPVLGTPNSAVLTITNDDALVSAGQLLISQFRLRGPNPNGAQNEFIEIYNNTDSPHTVGATDASAGYGVAASDGVLRCTIPNGTVIPARGHFLCVNSVGYSLGNYPSGNAPETGGTSGDANTMPVPKNRRRALSSKPDPSGTRVGVVPLPRGEVGPPNSPTATGDATYTTDIPDNAGIALFSSTTTFTLANRLDAVGSTSEANTLYKEGTGYPALTPLSIDYAFVRDTCGKGGSITTFGPCPAGGLPKDTDDNAADFYFVDTNGTPAGAGQNLGAPGPENLSSPVQRNSQFAVTNLDTTISAAAPPNRVRDFTVDPANNSTFGTLDPRKRVTNSTGAPVTRLRFRIVDLTTFPAPSGIADLRPRTSTLVVVSGINDAATCLASNGVATTPCTVNVEGTTLEQPPSQLNGGGFNSTLSAGTVTLGTPLADGASVNLHFPLGIQQTGKFKFFVNVEALP